MLQFFLNPWLLLGLLGVALPIMAHLLSRRRFDIVEWGAMQFLNPSRKTRRRLKLEELLLLVLRIGLIGLIVFAVTRPMIPGGWLGGYRSGGSRTVVIIIDGSNSMSRSDGVNSVHQNAIRRASEFLKTLGGDDSAALIDARDQPMSVIESPLRDFRAVEDQLRRLPPPGGACGMLAAVEKAIAILGRTSASAREVVVFSDRQGNGWKSDNDAEWTRFDDLLKFPAVRPKIWVVDVAPHLAPIVRNVSVGQISLSREMTVPDFPVRLQVSVRNDSDQEMQIPVRLLLDGQSLAGESQTPTVPARSETVLEFDHAIRSDGTHVLSVEAEVNDDAIAVDNISHAAIHVAGSLPLLLVNGIPSATPAERDTFFAELAFAPLEGRQPWVKTRVVEAAELRPDDFESAAVAMFCNVSAIPPPAAAALADFVAKGNGAFVACGSSTTPESFKACFADSGLMAPVQIVRTREAPPQSDEVIGVSEASIQTGWMDRFRKPPGRSLLKASFSAWCLPKFALADAGFEPRPIVPGEASPIVASLPIVLAQLKTGDSLVLESRYGEGLTLLMTSALDRSWSDLPTRSDFVPFLHEAVFHLASARRHRNVRFGEPLIARIRSPDVVSAVPDAEASGEWQKAASAAIDESVGFEFTTPGEIRKAVAATRDAEALVGVLPETFVPGIYSLKVVIEEKEVSRDAFVVNYDHAEDDLTQLTADDKARLATNDRVRFAANLSDLSKRMYGDESVTELWAVLMTLFLLFLISELFLTRRAIRKGYGGEALTAA